MKILLIDNYDSFVYNIVGLLEKCRQDYPDLEWKVVRNDDTYRCEGEHYDAVILSPGPGLPAEAGNMLSFLRRCVGKCPVLGICLGCQAIAEVCGCRLRQLETPRHGHLTTLRGVDVGDPVVGFCGDGSGVVGRYHSWVIDESSVGEDCQLVVTSRDEDGNIMSIRHKTLPVYGLQFHPESIMTVHGNVMLTNFLSIVQANMK